MMISLTVGGLEALLKYQSWITVELSGALDDWTGLIEFEEVSQVLLDCGEEDVEMLQAQVKVTALLEKITGRFLSTCRFANSPNDLRHPGAFVTLPSAQAGHTLIVGMVFKLDRAGTTYICFPSKYQELWETWFRLCKQSIDWLVVD